MSSSFAIACVLVSFGNPLCFEAEPVTTQLPGSLSIVAMNDNQVLTGMLDGNSNEMVVWSEGEVVTRVTSFYESYGILINNNNLAAGLGNFGLSQDERLIIANTTGEIDIVATITGSAGWSSLTAINENGTVVGNYSGGSGSSDWQAFIWSAQDGLQFILPTAETTYARDVDEYGLVTGQIQIGGNYNAMLWDNGILVNLAKLLNLKGNSAGLFFDDSGRVLISEYNNSIQFSWYDPSDSSVTEVHQFPAGSYTIRAVASPEGKVAFSWSSATLGSQLGRWSQELGFETAIIDENFAFITAIAIDQHGTVACSAFLLPFYDSIAMLWTDSSSPVSIHELVPGSPIGTQTIAMTSQGDLLLKGDTNYWSLSTTCEADVNTDGTRNVEDLLLVISAWGQQVQNPCGADINGNGIVDIGDILSIVNAWGPCQ